MIEYHATLSHFAKSEQPFDIASLLQGPLIGRKCADFTSVIQLRG